MSVHNLFSYRQLVDDSEMPDVFVYDKLPEKLRVQIIHIWEDAIGRYNNDAWMRIHDIVAREHGLLVLAQHAPNHKLCCETYLMNYSIPVEYILDLIEVSFGVAKNINSSERQEYEIKIRAKGAIKELNERFRRAGVGYQFEDGKLFRVDSELIHTEVVRPALRYLQQRGFEGPRDEFMNAHAHYRAGQMKDAITDANNAFESTLKTICEQRNWQYEQGSRASDILKVVQNNGLLPDYLDKAFDQLVATLKSGLPKVRNEEGAHGQGATPRITPDYVAAYALHLTAAKILFLVEAHNSLPTNQ